MKRISISIAIVMVLFLSSCDMIGLLMHQSLDNDNSGDGTKVAVLEPVLVEADSFVLAWNDDSPDSAARYTVFYSMHGTEDWTELTSVSSENGLQIEIDESLLARGEWDFGIISSSNAGEDSAMHTSLETSAIPTTGWYLVWI